MLAKLAGLLGVLALLFGYYLFFPGPKFSSGEQSIFWDRFVRRGDVLLGSAFLARSINRSRGSMKSVSKAISTATDGMGFADRKKQQDDLMLQQQAYTRQQQMNKQSQDTFKQQRELAQKQQEEWRRQQEQQRRRQ